MRRIHLDTDLGGDLDDLCALAMLLRWPGDEPLEITGITVVGDTGGRRTGMVRRVLEIAGRTDIPVAAGAETSGGYYPHDLGLPDEESYWETPVVPSPNPAGEAVALLKQGIDRGVTIVGIGPYTNLRLLEEAHPGTLATADVVLMGGYLVPPTEGYPAFGNEDDFNVQVDVASAVTVLRACSPLLVPLLVPLAVTVETALREAHLARLREGDALARLVARQAVAFAVDERMAERFGARCAHVPDDIINFQHDALACAIALGWRDGVTIEDVAVRIEVNEGVLQASVDVNGTPLRIVTKVDGARFSEFWLDRVAQDLRIVHG